MHDNETKFERQQLSRVHVLLVIVDTTVAPALYVALYVVGCPLCSSLKYNYSY